MPIEDLTFGAELECFLPQGASRQACAEAITARLCGANICQVMTYGHSTPTTWKLTTDGSLGDYAHGIEVVSPPLSGEAGLAQLEAVCDALTDFGCTVSRTAGFHVHVGAAGQPLRFWKNIVRLYAEYEPIIDAFMPASRRASANAYCRTMTTTAPIDIENSTTLSVLAGAIQRATNNSQARYQKVNVTAYSRHRTVEFRQHSGTIDARKTRNWVLTCLRMVEAAKGHLAFGGSITANPVNRARPSSKAYQIGEMLLRPEGTTGPEICARMGWPSVSVPAQARACGLDIYSQRTGRVVRYFVRRAQGEAAPNLNVTLDGFCDLINSAPSEREYLQIRTNNLRGAVAWAA